MRECCRGVDFLDWERKGRTAKGTVVEVTRPVVGVVKGGGGVVVTRVG